MGEKEKQEKQKQDKQRQKEQVFGFLNMNGISEDDRTCGLHDMNCLDEKEQGADTKAFALEDMNAVTEDDEKTCGLNDMNCLEETGPGDLS